MVEYSELQTRNELKVRMEKINLTPNQLAALSKVNVATIYAFFKGKDTALRKYSSICEALLKEEVRIARHLSTIVPFMKHKNVGSTSPYVDLDLLLKTQQIIC